jgi:hypothetical protein
MDKMRNYIWGKPSETSPGKVDSQTQMPSDSKQSLLMSTYGSNPSINQGKMKTCSFQKLEHSDRQIIYSASGSSTKLQF